MNGFSFPRRQPETHHANGGGRPGYTDEVADQVPQHGDDEGLQHMGSELRNLVWQWRISAEKAPGQIQDAE